MKKQKIIIDAYQYDSAITGTDRMAFNFLRELQEIDSTNRYFIICSSEKYIPEVIKPGRNFTAMQPWVTSEHPLIKRVIGKLWREVTLAIFAIRDIDTFYTFHNMRLPRFRIARRMISSNLDLITLKLAEYAGTGRHSPAREKERMRSVASKADLFISISEYSKRELHEILDVVEKKIRVIPLAADPIFSQKNKATSESLELPEKFIFTLGGSEPRKNVRQVVDAFCQLPKATQKEFPLYIAGGAWHGRPLDVLRKSPFVHTLGYVSNASLAQLYESATVFVFASQYEGFGFMIVEAMASGAPVIVAKNTSLTEVAADAGLLFKTTDINDLANKISLVVKDEMLQKRLSKKSTLRALDFSWQKSSQKLHAILVGKDN